MVKINQSEKKVKTKPCEETGIGETEIGEQGGCRRIFVLPWTVVWGQSVIGALVVFRKEILCTCLI